MNALALLLLIVNVGSVEQTYGPYVRPGRGGVHAMAVANGHTLMAWSERDPQTGRAAIRTVLLDARGRLAGAIHTFPASRSTADAVGPSVATNGDGFFVTWLDLDHLQQLRGVVLDANGAPAGAARAYTVATPIVALPALPSVAWDGTSYRIFGPLTALKLTAAGEIDTVTGPVAIPAAVGPDHAFGYVSTSYYATAPGCWFSFCFQSKYQISWNARGTRGTYWAGNDPISSVGMAPAGNRFGMVWSVPFGVSYLFTDGKYGSIWAEPNIDVHPSIACDSTDCVVAYGTRAGDVHAVAFAIARPQDTTVFTVAASDRHERLPQVHAIREGHFLVTYQNDAFAGEHLSGRMVTLGAMKRRSVR